MKRARYDKQFKITAVQMAAEPGTSGNEVSLALKISASSLRRWINE